MNLLARAGLMRTKVLSARQGFTMHLVTTWQTASLQFVAGPLVAVYRCKGRKYNGLQRYHFLRSAGFVAACIVPPQEWSPHSAALGDMREMHAAMGYESIFPE
mmetsp:Transcript_20131/g.46302  ORF Transcript_20131/g.46302 Transcript_20131/m.46302 type:complete len:103 (-) Transcript_20131:1234-1542(-)